MIPNNSWPPESQPTGQIDWEAEEEKHITHTQLTNLDVATKPSRTNQGQNELDQLAFELANKIAKGQMKLKETKPDQMDSEEIKAIKSNMIDWE